MRVLPRNGAGTWQRANGSERGSGAARNALCIGAEDGGAGYEHRACKRDLDGWTQWYRDHTERLSEGQSTLDSRYALSCSKQPCKYHTE